MTIPEGVMWYESAATAINVIVLDETPVLVSRGWGMWVVQ